MDYYILHILLVTISLLVTMMYYHINDRKVEINDVIE